MRKLSFTLLIFCCQMTFAQQKNVTLALGDMRSKNSNVTKDTALSAIKIANMVLNSQEFRDSVNKYDFDCKNYGERCSGNRIKGSVVLDSIYKNLTFELDLIIKNCIHEYGHAEEDKNYIQSCYYRLKRDDKKLPFTYIYAYHICHEYMHIVGFYHTNHKDDVGERIGQIAYNILKRWFDEKRDLN